MKLRQTFALIAVFLLLCAGYWFAQQHGEQKVIRSSEAKKLFDFAPEAVTRLSIQRLDEKASVAECDEGGTWSILEPNPTIRPLQMLWDRVAAQIAALKNERTIVETPETLKAFGLEEPSLTVQAEAKEYGPLALVFGDKDPTDQFRYARLDEGPVFLVEKVAYFELNRPLDDLRHRFLVNHRDAPLLRFEFVRIWTGRDTGAAPPEGAPEIGESSTAVALVRETGEERWRLSAPIEAPANPELADGLVKEVQFLVGRNYIDNPEDIRDYGLDPPQFRISVEDVVDRKPQVFLIGDLATADEKGGVFVKRSDAEAVFVVDGHMLTLFPTSTEAFRERRLLTRQAADIKAIAFESEKEDWRLERDEKNVWRMAAPTQSDTDQFAVSQYLTLLKEVAAIGFPKGNLADFHLNEPEGSLRLEFADGATGILLLTPEEGSPETYVATQDTGAIVRIMKPQAQQLLTDSGGFRSRELLRFAKSEAVRIEFTFEDVAYLLDKVHEKWIVRVPEDKTLANQSDAGLILDAINPLFAVAASPENAGSEEDAFGLKQPVLTLSVTTRAEAAPDEETLHGPIHVGAITPDNSQQRYATAVGRNGVFRISQDTVTTFREALRGLKPRS